MNATDDELSHAMALWMGKGTASWPQRDDRAVVARYGRRGEYLLEQIRAIHDAYFRSSAWANVTDVEEMLERATSEFRRRRPTVPNDVVAMLEWAYSYANR